MKDRGWRKAGYDDTHGLHGLIVFRLAIESQSLTNTVSATSYTRGSQINIREPEIWVPFDCVNVCHALRNVRTEETTDKVFCSPIDVFFFGEDKLFFRDSPSHFINRIASKRELKQASLASYRCTSSKSPTCPTAILYRITPTLHRSASKE